MFKLSNNHNMKKIMSFIIYVLFIFNITLADTLDNPYVEWLNLPWINEYSFEWWNELLILAKDILARAIQYLPLIVLIVLLLACIKIIFDWDWKAWLKRIKYILIWVALMILSIYIVNILSSIFFWHPVLNINFHRR